MLSVKGMIYNMYVVLPSGTYIYDNALVKLSGSDDKYLFRHGWYNTTNDPSDVMSGWYFQSVEDGSCITATSELLVGVTVLDRGDWIRSVTPSDVPCEHEIPIISAYRTNTKYYAGQIVFQEFGKLYQVCAPYVSQNISDDLSNHFITPIPADASAPYTNEAAPNVATVGDALDYIISKLSEIESAGD